VIMCVCMVYVDGNGCVGCGGAAIVWKEAGQVVEIMAVKEGVLLQ